MKSNALAAVNKSNAELPKLMPVGHLFAPGMR